MAKIETLYVRCPHGFGGGISGSGKRLSVNEQTILTTFASVLTVIATAQCRRPEEGSLSVEDRRLVVGTGRVRPAKDRAYLSQESLHGELRGRNEGAGTGGHEFSGVARRAQGPP